MVVGIVFFFLEEPNIGINLSARQAGVVGTNSVLQVPKLFNATPAKKWHNDRYQYQRVVFEICEVPPAVPLVPSPLFVILLKKLIITVHIRNFILCYNIFSSSSNWKRSCNSRQFDLHVSFVDDASVIFFRIRLY